MKHPRQDKQNAMLPYLGKPCIHSVKMFNNEWESRGEMHFDTTLLECTLDDSYDTKLILTPLTEVTDEHTEKVADILNFKDRNLENGHAFINEIINGGQSRLHFHPLFVWEALQFLQSCGYDLPSIHLKNKTLCEAGFAIYQIHTSK